MFDPRPLFGGWRWMASPAQNTRLLEIVVAKWWLIVHGARELTRISKSSVPTSLTARSLMNSSVKSGGPAAGHSPR